MTIALPFAHGGAPRIDGEAQGYDRDRRLRKREL